MASTNHPILVVGGGLGGASVALALARKGLRVCVLEQASEFGVIGYGIQLGPNAFHMFDRLGVSGEVLKQSIIPRSLLMLDWSMLALSRASRLAPRSRRASNNLTL